MESKGGAVMRIYEYSKDSGIPSKELLELLKNEGFDVKSHMSVLSEKELNFLQKTFEKKSDKGVSKSQAPSVENKEEKKLTTTAPKEAVAQPIQPKQVQMQQQAHAERNKMAKSTFMEKPAHEKVFTSPAVVAERSPVEIVVENMTVGDAAVKLGSPVTEVIVTLLKWGIVANKNQMLSSDVVERLAGHYQVKTIRPVAKKQEISKEQISTLATGEQKERAPVVVVVGHVDHGKTTLLDYIRKTRVAAKEKGGITQHLGAYEAKTPQGPIVFLDTPGHEAFSKMRMRGIKVADMVILVVAADDGIMPQTIEAIKHAKAMAVPITVAINKVDKVDAQRLEIIKRQLAQQDLLPEDWGGNIVCVPISAKLGTGVDQLLEMIVLQSQLMELKADVAGFAKGYVLESKMEKGRGPVATVLTQHGTIKIGDYFVCASGATGKVSSLVDSAGQRLKEAGPSVPVQIAGFEALPEAGDYFEVTTKEQQRKIETPVDRKLTSSRIQAPGDAIKLLIKTDSNSSKEALLESIEKLAKKTPKGFAIVQATVGDVSESDVELAADTSSKIITLHVKTGATVSALAQRLGVTIIAYDIIYKLLESLEEMAQLAKAVKMVRKKIGEAGVLRIFDIKNVGVIAGANIKEGRFSKDGTVKIFRGNKMVGEGKILSLQRDKKTVKEVHSGFECAFLIDGFNEWQVDDRVECYLEVPE